MTGIPVVSAAANFGERIGQTRRAIAERDDIDALIISDLNNVRWLTGLASSNAAALVTEAQVLLVTDSRYAQRAIAVDPLIDVVVYRAALATVLSAAIEAGVRTVGVEAESLSLASFEGLKTAIHETATELVATTGVIESLRATKDDSEVAALAMACTISTDALGALLPQIAPGMTEVQIARQLEFEMGRLAHKIERSRPSLRQVRIQRYPITSLGPEHWLQATSSRLTLAQCTTATTQIAPARSSLVGNQLTAKWLSTRS